MHLPSSLFLLSLCQLSTSSVIRRQDPGLQSYPDTAPALGSFSNGAKQIGLPDEVSANGPPIYGARSVDLPFGRLYHGNIKFFSAGQLNTPDKDTDVWGSANDNAEQSACGIPDNAFIVSKVAIHPYFLKYAGLDRYCMQDVCISFWTEDGKSDMMLKVTDICSTDPSDPTHCANPSDIKIDRAKAQIVHGLKDRPTGDQYPEKVWWFFMKCWADGLPQPAYQSPSNWFANPPLPNNHIWAQAAVTEQYKNNQAAYPAKGWPTYPNGAYNTKRDSETCPEITDWVPGQEPSWSPIAGGRGFGGGGNVGNSSSTPNAPSNSTSSTSATSVSSTFTTSSSTTSSATTSTGSTTQGPDYGDTGPTSTTSSATTSTGSTTQVPDNGDTGPTSTTSSATTSTGSTTQVPDYSDTGPTSTSTSATSSAPADGQQTGSSTAPDAGKQTPPPTTDPGTVVEGDGGECEA